MIQYPKAFIFDLDGVITDTAEYHYLAWKKLAESLGIMIDREFNEQLKGVSRIESLERILSLKPELLDMPVEEKEKLATKKNEHYKELINQVTPEDILPGIQKLLDDIKSHNIKIALGSASKNAEFVINRLGLKNYFDYIVDAAKIKKGKPDPETFTIAADYFGFEYRECIGVEDSAAGIEAINKAQMFSVGVGDRDHLSDADYLLSDTDDLNFDLIIEKYISNHK
ncbi:beta-phosphoglucomutase [Bacillus andreraoultii]|uniref:beta-phosphoglucomutase n=1 Tax=Bacillus andreraoultii TaxID=1499685 RepID=UPI0005AA2096|nr:beta-phosphoglucomutase [Bacillus andreraoultii]